MSDREIIYETAQGTRLRRVTAGAVQGSVLGPDLWNIMHDQVLRLSIPEETFTIGYGDDLVLVITAKDVKIAIVKSLERKGFPGDFISFISNMHSRSTTFLENDDQFSEDIEVRRVVRQGDPFITYLLHSS